MWEIGGRPNPDTLLAATTTRPVDSGNSQLVLDGRYVWNVGCRDSFRVPSNHLEVHLKLSRGYTMKLTKSSEPENLRCTLHVDPLMGMSPRSRYLLFGVTRLEDGSEEPHFELDTGVHKMATFNVSLKTHSILALDLIIEKYSIPEKPFLAEPSTLTVPAAGGSSTHKLHNTCSNKLLFKVTSSNNGDYTVDPVFGFVDPFGFKDIVVTRTAGAPKEDKLVIYFAKSPADATDAQAAFASVQPAGTITIPLSATA